MTMPRVSFHTLGCKLNQAESEQLSRQFADAGYDVASNGTADICVINTCTVTHIADRKSRHLVRLLRRRNPQALIVVTGCYAERAPQELQGIGSNIVVGNEDKADIIGLIEDFTTSASSCSLEQPSTDSVNRVRSFVKIQDGCNGSCAYCIVPTVRRREYCLPVADIVDQVKARVAAGYQEVVLTGTKIGTYTCDGASLARLVEQILSRTEIQRLHLSSLQPQEITSELLGILQDPRLCQHFHLALQNGCDTVLKRMRRRYTTADYSKAVSRIRQAAPDAAITTDIIVGFPGESSAEFEQSYCFCRDTGFAAIHVFPFSGRPGTAASRMPAQVKEPVKNERSFRMLKLAEESTRRFNRQFLGRNLVVLWENEVAPCRGIYSGLSHNYIRMYAKSHEPLTGQLSPAQPKKIHHDGLWAEVIR